MMGANRIGEMSDDARRESPAKNSCGEGMFEDFGREAFATKFTVLIQHFC
jgi:hypothetical protein